MKLNGELAAGDLGISGARVVVPRHPEKSVLLQRISRNDVFRMPPMSVNDRLQSIVPLVREWIEHLGN